MWALVGCGDESDSPALPDGGAGTGGVGGSASCPPGEQPLADGSCEPAGATAGTAPDQCADGFVSDDEGGCSAQIPPQPCSPGQIAQLGELDCHELATCGSSSFGDIPDEVGTQYVDPSFSGVSDGTELAPWTTIADAVQAAAPAAIVALAAGTYAEDVRLDGKAVRLWGRCPSMVTIEGAGIQPAAVSVVATDGVEVRGLAVTGPRMGVWVLNSDDAGVQDTWIHDTEELGLAVRGATTRLSADTVLVESARGSAVLVEGAAVDIAQSTIRSTRSRIDEVGGYGMVVQVDRDNGEPGSLTVRSCVVEQSRGAAVSSIGAQLEVVGTLVRDTLPDLAGQGGGVGILADLDLDGAGRATLLVESSEVVRSVGYGVVVHGSDVTIDATSIRDVAEQAGDTDRGWGVGLLEHGPHGQAITAAITESLIERSHGAGLYAMGGTVDIDRTIVRDTRLLSNGHNGRGIEFNASPTGLGATSVAVRSCVVSGNHEVGLLAAGVELTLEASVIEHTLPNLTEGAGFGLIVEHDELVDLRADAQVRWCTVDSNIGSGVVVAGADGLIESTLVTATRSRPNGTGGEGITIQYASWNGLPGLATVRNCRVEDNEEMGIFVDGSQATIESTEVSLAGPNGLGHYGDCICVKSDPQYRAVTRISESNVHHCHRAGLLSVGAVVELTGITFDCNPIHLNGEDFAYQTFSIADLGGNVCGCAPESEECRVLSTGLSAPEPVY